MQRREVSFLFLSTFLLLPSIFGRTPFISAFKPYLMHTVPLSGAWISFSYTLGTLCASLLVPIIVCTLGKDFSLRSGFRLVYVLQILGLCGFLCALQCTTVAFLCFLFLSLGYVGLRLCCQGLLPTLVKTYVATSHNDCQCAWIAIVHTASIVLVLGILLYYLAAMDAFLHWSVVLCCQIALLLFFCIRLSARLPQIQSISITSIRSFRLVYRGFPRVFKWGIAVIALQNLQATAMAFHLSDFAQEQDIPLATIFKVFLPISIGELLFNPLVALLYPKCTMRTLFLLVLGNLAMVNFSLFHFHASWSVALFIVTSALGWSFNHVLLYSLPARVLPKDQQAIGYAIFTAWVNLCSACGPFLYSILAQGGLSYLSIGGCMCLFILANALACFTALRPTYTYDRI